MSILGMMGSSIQELRDTSVILLNLCYDGVDWQSRAPMSPQIACVGDAFTVDYLIEMDNPDDLLILMLNSFPLLNIAQNNGKFKKVVSWHVPVLREYKSKNIETVNKKYVVV